MEKHNKQHGAMCCGAVCILVQFRESSAIVRGELLPCDISKAVKHIQITNDI